MSKRRSAAPADDTRVFSTSPMTLPGSERPHSQSMITLSQHGKLPVIPGGFDTRGKSFRTGDDRSSWFVIGSQTPRAQETDDYSRGTPGKVGKGDEVRIEELLVSQGNAAVDDPFKQLKFGDIHHLLDPANQSQ